ncbi:hypothetical protein RND71_042043 [Anisodus tanguticus]|uniref:Uncharacterized protein n=1 Tax=Anisodus tanguticus TaxID=243964 RepID=A0AAE1URV5_9SOLA|nr:hypothetical protein RND71_042043 [Anisodus tanguticus]
MDKATSTKTRPSTAKLRVKIDLLKPLIDVVTVEVRNSRGEMETFTQIIKYETIPLYCLHCNIQGHDIDSCGRLHPELKEHNVDFMKNENNAESSRKGQYKNQYSGNMNIGSKSNNLQQGKETRQQRGHNKGKKDNKIQEQKKVEGANNDKEGWNQVENKKGKSGYNNKAFRGGEAQNNSNNKDGISNWFKQLHIQEPITEVEQNKQEKEPWEYLMEGRQK